MRPRALAFPLIISAAVLAAAGCEDRRRPSPGGTRGGSTPPPADSGTVSNKDATALPDSGPVVPKDAGGGQTCACDLTTACDPGCACDPECAGCACDLTTSCDPGCACDPECVAVPDGGIPDFGPVVNPDATAPHDTGVLNCASNPYGCVPHQLMNPDCSCLPACEGGWQWSSQHSMCLPATRPDTGVGYPDAAAPPDAGIIQTDPFDLPTSVQRYSQALCGFRTRCEPAVYDFERTTPADCLQQNITRWTSVWGAYHQAVTAGRVAFSQGQFEACMQAMNSADCELGLPDGCDRNLLGSRLLGQGCSLLEECALGLYCDSGSNACGTCRTRTPDGMDCSSTFCLEGSVCATAGTQQVCVRLNPEHSACGTIQTGLCKGALQCVGSGGSGTCRRAARAGQTCDQQRQSAPDCNILMNQLCANGTCQANAWSGPTGSCAPPSLCDNRSICDGTAQTCTELPGAGQPCNQDRCAPDHYCQAGTCAAQLPAGQSCPQPDACGPGLFCNSSGTCGPLEYAVCP